MTEAELLARIVSVTFGQVLGGLQLLGRTPWALAILGSILLVLLIVQWSSIVGMSTRASEQWRSAVSTYIPVRVAGSARADSRLVVLPREPEAVAVAAQVGWGWLPPLSAVGSLGLLLIATADMSSRQGESWAEVLFWSGLLVLFAPIAWRLVSERAARQERLGLVVFLGMALYLVKVLQTPSAFTFPDELAHIYNVDRIVETVRLFHQNADLPVTAFYPGLATVTSALTLLTGLPPYTAGVLVIAAARLVLLLALFLFFERVSQSARVAGIACLLYMANSNFVFFNASFAYESLALPLAAMVLLAVLQWQNDERRADSVGFTFLALLGIFAVVVTHHLTAYALVAALFIVCVLYRLVAPSRRAPWLFFLVALVATLAWLLGVANITFDYLTPVISGALATIGGIFRGAFTFRELFRSSSGELASLAERVIGISSVLLILLGLPFGLRQVWRRYRTNPFALLLGLASLAYIGTLALRFFRATWEIANRSNEFAFIGVGFVLAVGLAPLLETLRRLASQTKLAWINRPRPLPRALLVSAAAIVFVGGIIAGWQPSARLARPYTVAVDSQLIEPQGITAAKWTRAFLGPGNRIAADSGNARLIFSYGDQVPLSGEASGIKNMFYLPGMDQSVKDILHDSQARYVLVDRRVISWDLLVGLYFDRIQDIQKPANYFDEKVYGKFDTVPFVSRIYDSGNIAIYDIAVLSNSSGVK